MSHTDPTLDNDYDEEESNDDNNEMHSETSHVEEEKVVILKPLTFVLGRVFDKDYTRNNPKELVLFKGTSKGWKSYSYASGQSNDYVSNETWDLIEEDWLKATMKSFEVFQDEDELLENLSEVNLNNDKTTAYRERGLTYKEEVDTLKKMAGV